jgi:hypothetical protein
MEIVPLAALARTLFGRAQDTKIAGLEIFTDRSLELGTSQKSLGVTQGRSAVVSLNVVPQQIEFVQRSRISEQVIKDGKAFFFWRKDRHSKHLDLMEVRLTGITRSLARETKVTGNLSESLRNFAGEIKNTFVRGTGKSMSVDEVTKKQQDWLTFWNITRESYIDEQGINEHHIRLKTPAIPAPVEFVGHFAGPIQWSQNARNPFLADWQLSLIVHRTDPSLDILFNDANSLLVEG